MNWRKNITPLLALLLTIGATSCRANQHEPESMTSAYEDTNFFTTNVKQERKVTNYSYADFQRLNISGEVRIVLMQGNASSVKVEECPNPNLVTYVEKNADQLRVYTKTLKKNLSIKNEEMPVVYITMPHLNAVTMSGATAMQMDGFKTANLHLSLSGASKISCQEAMNCDDLIIGCSGASSISLATVKCHSLQAKCSGASKLKADVNGDEVLVDNSGASNVNLNVNGRQMEMQNSGASTSNVTFKGRRLQARNTGAGKVDIHVDCEELAAQNTGAASFVIAGTADQTNIDASGVSKINTSKLNKF